MAGFEVITEGVADESVPLLHFQETTLAALYALRCLNGLTRWFSEIGITRSAASWCVAAVGLLTLHRRRRLPQRIAVSKR